MPVLLVSLLLCLPEGWPSGRAAGPATDLPGSTALLAAHADGAAAEVLVPQSPPRAKGRRADGWSGVVLRIEFINTLKNTRSLGTGFVVRDPVRRLYLVTCAHLIRDKEWVNRYSVRMHTMDGRRRIESFGPSVFVGKTVDLKHLQRNGWPDLTGDLVVRSIPGAWARPLPLAAVDPQPGDMAWAVGCEATAPASNEQLFAGRIVQVSEGGFVFEKTEAFDPRGFSGGPIINARGEVVGNIVAGAGNFVGGATAMTLRRRLAEAGIYPEGAR